MSALCLITGGLLASESSSAGGWTYCKMEVDGRDRCHVCARLKDNHIQDCGCVFFLLSEGKKKFTQLEEHG